MSKFAEQKATMTLNLSYREMAVLDDLAAQQDMSKTAVMRAALRLYQLVHIRMQEGETFSFSGDKGRAEVFFIQPGFGESDPSINGEQ